MTDEMINELKNGFSKIDHVDPCAPTFKKMRAFLDTADSPTLAVLAKAEIKFVSLLAMNRLAARGAI